MERRFLVLSWGAGQDGRVVDHGRSGRCWSASTDAVLLSALLSATIYHGCCARLCNYKLLVRCAKNFLEKYEGLALTGESRDPLT